MFNLRILRGQDGLSKGSAFGVCKTLDMVPIALQ
jgi:ATP-dependent RNA helicase DDX21